MFQSSYILSVQTVITLSLEGYETMFQSIFSAIRRDAFLVAVKTRLLNPYPRTSIYTKGCNLTKLQITTYKTLQNSTSTTKKFKIDNYFFAIFDHVN